MRLTRSGCASCLLRLFDDVVVRCIYRVPALDLITSW
jgi:hypothetical protein